MTRIPGKESDSLVQQYPTKAKHIIVMVNDQMFKVNVLGEDRTRVPISEIERLLLAVGKQTLQDKPEPAVGILTAGHRDTNYAGYEKLISLSSENKENFETIKDALFILCLDDHAPNKNTDISHQTFFHSNDASNRFFDKAVQVVVTSSGRAGMNGEVRIVFHP